MTDEEKKVIEALKVLKDYCEETESCYDCIMINLCEVYPCKWKIPEIEEVGEEK